MKVQAAVLYALNEALRIEEVELRKPLAGEVLVKVKASGICHSDLSVVNGALPFNMPIILGHEGAGEVLEVGEGVTLVKVGDRVILNNIPECGKCRQCKNPFSNVCKGTGFDVQRYENPFKSDTSPPSPFTGLDGSPVRTIIYPATFATHCVVEQHWLTPFSQDIPFEEAALIGCGVLTGIGCTQYATQVFPGSSVAVFGLGSIGLNIIQGARLQGASVVIALDINPKKEAIARQFGATHFINPAQTEGSLPLSEIVTTILGGERCVDFAFEATGNTTVLQTAASLVHPYWGVCVAVGIPHHATETKLPATTFAIGRTVKGVYFGNAKPISTGKQILEYYAQKKIQIAPLITHRISLKEVNTGIELLAKGEAVRVVIVYE